ncbi:hypothetical protein GLIP_4271 [Aliiglaciecola lipolytica E3]|uniref:Sulfatase N-terminal domain-containing protein n=2 Tax=Aliiglaciecola TaxID=1406885 RepID=K6YFG2_9ALTE|nr:hypothetical protein GLIP_4271 [Aliiglaciecola lipolytica E3]
MDFKFKIVNTIFSSMSKASIQSVILFLTFWNVLAYNIPFVVSVYNIVGHQSLSAVLLLSFTIFSLCILNMLFLTLISIKPLFKVLVVMQFLISTILLYSNATGKQYNPFAFDFYEWLEGLGRFFTFHFLLMLVFLVCLPSFTLLKIQIKWGSLKNNIIRWVGYSSISILILWCCFYLFETRWSPVYHESRSSLRNIVPFHFLDSSLKFIKQQYLNPIYDFTIIDSSPTIPSSKRNTTVVLVVAESVRADMFLSHTINPLIQSINTQGITIEACNTYHTSSLQCIFSFLSTESYSDSKGKHQQNLLDIMSLAGVNIYWLANENQCGDLCIKASIERVPFDCQKKDCSDEELVNMRYHRVLSELSPSEPNLIILHLKNISSPLYSKSYPKSVGSNHPTCDTALVSQCTDTQLINSYKNSLNYVTQLLIDINSYLEEFQNKYPTVETALVFTSNHGESLGEGGLYFHGAPKNIAPKEQLMVPLLLSDSRLNSDCISKSANGFTHDQIVHTLLHKFNIATKAYKANADIYTTCEQH